MRDNKKDKKDKRAIDKESAIKKLNNADLSSEELGLILSVDDRTVRNILNKLCQDGVGLKLEDFKERGSYKFKYEWNGILTILLQAYDLARYDKRKSQDTLEAYVEYTDSMLDSIDKYLSQEDQALVKSHSTYQQAKLEQKLHDVVIYRLGEITAQLGLMPASLRFQALAGINEALENVPSYLAQKNAGYTIARAQYKEHAKKSKGNPVNETSFKEDIESYLVSLLALRLQGIEGVEESMDLEVIGATLLEQHILGNPTGLENKGVEKIANESRERLLNEPEAKDVLERVASVLNPENPFEKILLGWIEETVILIELKIHNKKSDMELGGEIVRRAVTKQVIRDLKRFNTPK